MARVAAAGVTVAGTARGGVAAMIAIARVGLFFGITGVRHRRLLDGGDGAEYTAGCARTPSGWAARAARAPGTSAREGRHAIMSFIDYA
ncbi:hypothetical protein AKI39_22770 [Bordetella sp. H567]|nr:hypothetical protein AKI39_22770 [Bordetella sp. H567]